MVLKYFNNFFSSSHNMYDYVEPTVELHINESMDIQDDSRVPVFEVTINNGITKFKCHYTHNAFLHKYILWFRY